MTVADMIAAPISRIWIALGGDQPKHGRARAFYRDGGNPQAVVVNDAKGTWYDFRDGAGGGILDLIGRVNGGSRGDALKWLADFTGLRLDGRPPTAAERADYARRREYARQKACDVARWRDAFVIRLNAEKLAAKDAEDFDALKPAASLCNTRENGTAEPMRRGTSMDEWRANQLNRIFAEKGVAGKPGRITAATIAHGAGRLTPLSVGPAPETSIRRVEIQV